nr:hypothetical protein [Tanacetum cinerariifolium]
MTKEHDQQAQGKGTPKRLAYESDKEAPERSLAKKIQTDSLLNPSARLTLAWVLNPSTSLESEYEEGSEGTDKDLSSPNKRPKPTPFTIRITHFKHHPRTRLLRNINVYDGNKDPEDHLGIFLAATEQEEWPMHVWCKIFRQTLGGATRNWFDDLDPKSVNNFKEMSQKFLKEFLHHGHPKLAKKLNDKIPKTVQEMFERVRAFIQEEVAAGSTEMVWPSQGDKGNACPVWSVGHERSRNRSGPNTNDCYQLMKQIEEAVASGKLAHLVKEIIKAILRTEVKEETMKSKMLIAVQHHNQKDGNEKPKAIGSTIHSMIKFSTNQGIMTMETSKEALWECKQWDKMQSTIKEAQWHQREEQMYRIKEHARLPTENSFSSGAALPEKGMAQRRQKR